MYLRLHGDESLYASGYTDAALDRWAKRISAWTKGKEPGDAHKVSSAKPPAGKSRDIYCYFDNDVKVRAPFDADRLMQKLKVARNDKDFVFPDRKILKKVRPLKEPIRGGS
jgi:uncharacterized protein YecE (DUF72 family)